MGKRGNGEGYVYQNSRGLWIVRTQVGWLDNGHPKFKTFSGKTRKEALMRKKEYDNKCKVLESGYIGTIKDEMENWLYNKKKPALKPSSFDRLKMTIENHILPILGKIEIDKITSDDIQVKVINKMMSDGLSYSSVKKAYDALNGFYKQCIADRKLIYNPISGVVMPNGKSFNTKKARALNKEEIESFERTATAKYGNGRLMFRHGYGYIFILYTAIRSGEALALQYKHIDLENKTVKIEQTFVRVKDEKRGGYKTILQKTTKSENGTRTIPLCDKAIDAIKHHIEINYKGNDEEFVFASSKGTPLSYRNFNRSINSVYNKAKINASGFHILRHTMASLMFAKKIDIKYISKFLGHSGVQITYDTYVHIAGEFEEKLREELNVI